MEIETFFEKFDRVADAPNAVAKMRELVLRLAVHGRLVEQIVSEGRAREALDHLSDGRISATEPSRLGRYELPGSWMWVSFASVGEQRLGKMLDQRGNRGELRPYLRNTNVQWMRFALDDIKEMRLENDELDEFRLKYGDLLICEGGEPGRCAIWRDHDREMYFQKALHRIRVRADVLPDYLAINLRVDARNGVLDHYVTGATIKHFTGRSLREYTIPLPPLAEQQRIVAKVDELMALCDRLEAQQQEREARHAGLARAALARFAGEGTGGDLEYLFHRSYCMTPDDLRRCILQLAFAGRLVSQDPRDEPASTLLEKARAEKARLISAGIVKKEPWADKLHDASVLYALPLGWEWTHVSDVVEKVTVGFVGSMKEHYRDDGIPFLRSQNVRVNRFEPVGLICVSDEFHRSIGKSTLRPGDVVVTRSGSVGVTCVVPDSLPEANCSDLVIIKRPLALVPAFLSYFINSIAAGQIEAKSVGVALTHFNTQSVAQLTVALPPLAEQSRIMAKVDRLMFLVGQLEAQLAASRTTAANLLDGLVAELTTSP